MSPTGDAAQPGSTRQSPSRAAAGDRRSPAGLGASESLGERFEVAGAYELDPLVSVRSERFGALLYHGGSRRLLFLRVMGFGEALAQLGEYRSAAALLGALPEGERRRARGALAALLEAGFIRPRADQER